MAGTAKASRTTTSAVRNRRRRSTARGKAKSARRWSRHVTEHSDALTLDRNVFTWNDPKRIAASLKRSAERSRRRKASPFRSALSMLTFYINRAGRNLPASRKRTLMRAKHELRRQFGKAYQACCPFLTPLGSRAYPAFLTLRQSSNPSGTGGGWMPTLMTVQDLERFLAAEFPQLFHTASGLSIEAVWDGGSRVRQAYRDGSVRPGGTISGPTMMALADFAMYVAVLAAIGPVPLAVTTNLNINFLRKPARRDLVAEARLLKLGKRLAVGEVTIRSEGEAEPVAHVTSTYSIPPRHGN